MFNAHDLENDRKERFASCKTHISDYRTIITLI